MTKLHHSAKDLAGQRFGRLVVLEPTKKKQNNYIVWKCACDCGNIHEVNSNSLKTGNTKSCGCIRKELITKHGLYKSPIYKSFCAMISRCYNPKDPAYKNYGGRGIRVCERWHDIHKYYADVGDCPEGKTLDRWPDNDGDYEPGNWRYATPKEQASNRRPLSSGPQKQRWFYGHGPNGEMIIENNQRQVARVFDLCSPDISQCLHGKHAYHKGWRFQWITF